MGLNPRLFINNANLIGQMLIMLFIGILALCVIDYIKDMFNNKHSYSEQKRIIRQDIEAIQKEAFLYQLYRERRGNLYE